MHARVTTLTGSPESMADGVKMINEEVIPAARQLDGLVGGYWLADRSSGKFLGITLWESEEAMRASEETARQMRDEATTKSGGVVQSVERYEVVGQA